MRLGLILAKLILYFGWNDSCGAGAAIWILVLLSSFLSIVVDTSRYMIVFASGVLFNCYVI